ncbi:MAG: nif-specific transcriptional activator NifA [Magnetococcales bacterium]|nr:nif-specific transcriptional activator NifA [Magnetococcales bacterium]MBF0115750.1 nif-specific transcriptional activator NifA [Magnetococcales bacterium]
MDLLDSTSDETTLTWDEGAATLHLGALFQISRILQQAQDLTRTLQEVVEALAQTAGMNPAVVTLVNEESGALFINAVHPAGRHDQVDTLCYRSGEGVLGTVLMAGKTVLIERAKDEPRLLNRLGLLDRELPFIGVPIRISKEELIGVLAAQPRLQNGTGILYHARFLEMVAQLLVQCIVRARKVFAEKQDLLSQRDQLLREMRCRYGFDNIIGRTASMQAVFEMVRLVAKWSTTVLLRGESGTGKELIAHAIHYNSPRAKRSFVRLNCAALPDNLLESELFGHERGAFTGAVNARKGRFELAHHGTLFLDELGEISPSFQAKLLRVLQEGEFERVGGENPIRVDVRIIAATNRNLEEAVARGSFRQDLYYRLNVLTIELPSLRARKEDIPDLARFQLAKISKRQGRRLVMTEAATRTLMLHDWPGNVRELENCLERAAVLCYDGVIRAEAIQSGLAAALHLSRGDTASTAPLSVDREMFQEAEMPDAEASEKERIEGALRQAGWVKAKAARLLGMTPRQIGYRIKLYGIETLDL